MKKIVLSILLLSSITHCSNEIDKLDQAIINSDIDALQTLLKEKPTDANECTRMADLAQQIINKRKSNLEHFSNGFNLLLPCDKSKLSFSDSIIRKITIASIFIAFLPTKEFLIPIFLHYKYLRKYNVSYYINLILFFSTTIVSKIAIGGTIRMFVVHFREKIKKIRELNLLHDNSIKIKNLLLKELSNNENQTISLKL